ncbi:hypothetical protein [Crossiella cryophila]|uniref:Uncharacterized protein n=1 Tax=Crossiella cryophila TaxID=43355 RepID=A0A7W7CCN4_9PSEU|nr:hypothetical protein [Crossiella cryophila]MBB4678674.1 hypothetical protein [Crossiella cryophila]
MPRLWWLKALLVLLIGWLVLASAARWWPFQRPTGPDLGAPHQVCPAAPAPGQPVPAAVPHHPEGPAYTGPGPHPIAVFDRASADRQLLAGGQLPHRPVGVDELTGFTLPPRWRPTAERGTDARLVACVYYAALGTDERMCRYHGSAILLHSATYTVVVREARTAREVATFDLASRFISTERREPEQLGCPRVTLQSTGRNDGTMPPVNAEFLDALRPLAEQSR